MAMGHGSWVMWVMGQLCDGSHGSWVTKDDPFPSLLIGGGFGTHFLDRQCRGFRREEPKLFDRFYLRMSIKTTFLVLPVRILSSSSFSATSISYKSSEMLAIWPRFLLILATFYSACAETLISELPVTILTTPLDSATPIS